MKTYKLYLTSFVILIFVLNSCSDFLEREPLSNITPESYLNEESQLAAYAIDRYGVLSEMGAFISDNQTDIQASRSYDNKYVPGEWKVPQSGGDWSFGDIYQCNYFLENVVPKWKEGQISGNPENISHYVGEVYFLRAYVYFQKLMALGDFPIVKETLEDEMLSLVAASKRSPRNEVARFILSDLDSAAVLMKDISPDGNKNRLSKDCAYLLKSRVALFEGTWLKHFNGTSFVPNGPGWPGAQKEYNKDYVFPSGSIENEIDYFLSQSMEASKLVADNNELTINSMTDELEMSFEEYAIACENNPYLQMFGSENMGAFSEVLLWRAYDVGLGLPSYHVIAVQEGGGVGYTKGLVDGFLMKSGLPIYAENSNYYGDDFLSDVRKGRDRRLNFFLAEPGQINILYPSPLGTHGSPIAIIPDVLNLLGNHDQPTGYHHTKGNNFDGRHYGQHTGGSVGSVIFRASEAYLNYIEACYEKNNSIDNDALTYWRKIRERAGLDTDIDKTIAATEMTEEAKIDWASYSSGILVDATLYNIRRERKCELFGEGLRYNDLKRWRSMDQMITTPYHVEGFKIWGPMKEWYDSNKLTYDIGNESTVSSPVLSDYLRIHQKTKTSLVYDGYRWHMAHYLNPIAIQHFLITSDENNIDTSPIYQNPMWPTNANQGAIDVK